MANAPTVRGYDIIGELGRGGMGVVYKARQIGLERLVALKMILAGAHARQKDLDRFRAGAQAVARFQHPNIVQIYEVGETEGLPYFSLEFVDGETLAGRIAREPQPPKFAAETMEAISRAMQYAHERGVVHRDLKPADVLITTNGTRKVMDFGLAKRLEQDSGTTQAGTVLGTPSYMAPEQAMGDTDKVGPLADVYSLGAMLYDMLTGRPPFSGSSVLDTLEMVRTREPVPRSRPLRRTLRAAFGKGANADDSKGR
ncbi:MAG TPA: serine/threonine-protein kinase [Gemmataceae bacterium]|jgi:serine/threonine protein kinase|nr:serine/threonine-protein kinase [Gemmataceae bacterium]